ncbi:MAG: molybdopterin-guanine dinucleotide biosynthesis protein B [Deltaproteobacteria bacterium]|nr:molybdopterin-guanine dinucleotide biosynthesis protein B [Deltaproteobacteria bacterium]NCP95620.1 molybdopterin-guanine dinucleotide biosynthesis protein B [Deltaproteobacteria bacterium]NCS72993.1 molybdopterin-guanine dinucleotide biosynthesis protein B [Deltaproteobacteria bacterium]OIP64729.1 MAG: molybdopterin-guanine dinucleotide biosynthesis protein B [Nitrospirae bacterium CG2_30_70_394]
MKAGRAAFAVCGWSGSGKTTLLEAVLPELVRQGLAVAVVKHDAHGVSLDTPGKDSDRLFRAGADICLRGPGEVAWRRRPGGATALEAVIDGLLLDHDLVLVEGHKLTPLPKVWLAHPDDSAVPAQVTAVAEWLAWGAGREERLLARIAAWLDAAGVERPLFGGLLVGGASRRMGRPKQLLTHGGRSLAEISVAALAPHVGEVLLLGGGEVAPALAHLRRLPDPPGVAGPLAGLLAAHRWAPEAAWLVAACDLPLVSPAAVGWLKQGRRPGRWAVVPGHGGSVEPLLAAYEPQALHWLEGEATAGRLAPRVIGGHPKVATPAVGVDLAAAWTNVNTPAALAALEGEG